MSIDNGTPHNYRAYQTQRQKGANCVPYGGGAQGFDITVNVDAMKNRALFALATPSALCVPIDPTFIV